MVFETHITLIIGGLLLGGIYSMIAFGLTLTFGVSRVLNIAHGDFLILGSVIGLMLFELFGINPFLSIAIVAPLFTAVGIAIERGLIRTIINRAAERALTAAIIVTVGLSMAIEDSTAYYLGQAGGWAGGLGYISNTLQSPTHTSVRILSTSNKIPFVSCNNSYSISDVVHNCKNIFREGH
jgi:branched-subunit amino acid ABC-type transport system permease component